MIIKEISSKTILCKSKVYPYVINPYVGCQHGCSYCYASFMKRFTGHKEPWGEFVDVKVNAPDLLRKEVLKKNKNKVWISGVCDPYQPLEKKYKLTRECLKILVENDWPITIQTRSSLVLRDIDILKIFKNIEVWISIPTIDDKVRKIFEPKAPPIFDRIKTLAELHTAGIKTVVMIAPILPGAEGLVSKLAGTVDYIHLDKMNYHNADSIYEKNGLKEYLSYEYFYILGQQIKDECEKLGIDCNIGF